MVRVCEVLAVELSPLTDRGLQTLYHAVGPLTAVCHMTYDVSSPPPNYFEQYKHVDLIKLLPLLSVRHLAIAHVT